MHHLVIDRISIDAEENLDKRLDVGHATLLGLGFEHLDTLAECFALGIVVKTAVGGLTIEKVVGNVVVWPQMIVVIDAAVDDMSHLLMILALCAMTEADEFAGVDGRTDFEMHTSLEIEDAELGALDVFSWVLDIVLVARHIDLEGLLDVTWLPLVGDADRQQMELNEGEYLVITATHAEHLDEALIGVIVAILGTTIALRYPHRTVLVTDDVTDVLRQVHRASIELLGGTASLDTEHLVRLADVNDQLRRHEIGSEGDLGGRKAVLVQHVLQKTRIKHDVAMIGDEKIRLLTRDARKAIEGERRDAAGNDLIIERAHHLRLKLIDAAESGYHATHLLDVTIGEDVLTERRKQRMSGYALHSCRYLVLIIGTYVIELIHKK